MKTKRTNKYWVMGIICAVVLLLGLGFAAFSSNLKINSGAAVNPNSSAFSVIFSSNGTSTSSSQTVAPSSTTYGSSATIANGTSPVISGLNAKFTEPGQSVTYSFYALNKGSYQAYLNYITFMGQKSCTVATGSGADQSKVNSACNGISMSVKVGSDAAVTSSTSLMTNHTLAAGAKEAVVVTISYNSNATRVDGAFNVSFGDVKLTYSTVSNYTE